MATVLGVLSYHFIDALGITGETTLNVEIDDSKTVAQVATDAASGLSAVSPLSLGNCYSVTLRLALPGNIGSGAGEIEKNGVFNFNNATDPYATGVAVPALAASILNTSGLIDLTNASVTSFITWMTTAHTAITVVTKGVRALTGLKDALISFRKHRKPLSRRTKEV
jgi:hypothetical protein